MIVASAFASIATIAPAPAAEPWRSEQHDTRSLVGAPTMAVADAPVGAPGRVFAGSVAELWSIHWHDDTGSYKLLLTWGQGAAVEAPPTALPSEDTHLWVLRCWRGSCTEPVTHIDELRGTANDGELHATIDDRPFHATCAGDGGIGGFGRTWSYGGTTGPIGSGAESWNMDDDYAESMIDAYHPTDDGLEHVCVIDGLDPDSYREYIARRVRGNQYAYWRPL